MTNTELTDAQITAGAGDAAPTTTTPPRVSEQAAERITPKAVGHITEDGGACMYNAHGMKPGAKLYGGPPQAIAITLQAAPEAPTATKADLHSLRRLIECAETLDARPRPMCRDCADENGTCPNSGLECDMRKLFAAVRSLHNKLASPAKLAAAPVPPVPAPAPIQMILHCPKCGLQHVDAPDERTEGWTNPPHRSHLCHGCGHIWRPADVHTEGVKAIQTRGTNDSAPAEPDQPHVIAAPAGQHDAELVVLLAALDAVQHDITSFLRTGDKATLELARTMALATMEDVYAARRCRAPGGNTSEESGSDLAHVARQAHPVHPIPTAAQADAAEAQLYRDLTGDVLALGYQGLADAVQVLRQVKAATDAEREWEEAKEMAARRVEADCIGFAKDDTQLRKIASDIRAMPCPDAIAAPTLGSAPQAERAAVPNDEQCDQAAAQAMDRVAAKHGMHAMHIKADVRVHDDLRRALVRAGFDLAAPVAQEGERSSAQADGWNDLCEAIINLMPASDKHIEFKKGHDAACIAAAELVRRATARLYAKTEASAQAAPVVQALWRWRWEDARGQDNPWRYVEGRAVVPGQGAIVEAFCPAAAQAAPAEQRDAERDVLAERQRQMQVEGWTPEHDDKYQGEELRLAALCYMRAETVTSAGILPASWPWAKKWWKPSTDRRNLIKAGALILAEIERIDRAALRSASTDKGEAA